MTRKVAFTFLDTNTFFIMRSICFLSFLFQSIMVRIVFLWFFLVMLLLFGHFINVRKIFQPI